MRRPGFQAALFGAFLSFACGRSQDSAGDSLLRLIPVEPGTSLALPAEPTEPLMRWSSGASLVALAPGASGVFPSDERDVRPTHLPGGSRHLLPPLEGGAIGAFEINLFGAGEVDVELRWSFRGEDSVAHQAGVCRRIHRLHQCVVALSQATGWRTGVVDAELMVSGREGLVVVQEIRALAPALRSGSEAAEATGVRVTLAGDQRNALALRSGELLRRSLRVPAAATLRFALGRPEQAFGRPMQLRLHAASELLFEQTLEADCSEWQEARVSLERFAGRDVELVVSVDGDPEGMALWANPEVVVPRRDPRPNVILVSVDTLRADRLSLYGHDRSTSPHLDRRAEQGATVFENVVAQAPWTLPSHASLFTGLDANRHQANMANAVSDELTTLAEILRRRGFATAAFTGGAFLDPRYGFSQGFDSYYASSIPPHLDDEGEELSEGVDRALAWLETHHQQPFFLFLHTYEVHSPYRPRQPYYRDFTDLPEFTIEERTRVELEEEGFRARRRASDLLKEPRFAGWSMERVRELIDANYDSGVAYADAQLERLWQRLDALDLWRDTVVVLTSDHGETLGEGDSIGHLDLREENVLVPLVLFRPRSTEAGRRVQRQVRSVDILPTVLELVGLEPPETIDGVSLVPLTDGGDASVPPEAFSYGPRWNAGLLLRYDGRFRYLLNDTAWSPLQQQEEFEWLSVFPQDQVPERPRRLRRAVEGFHSRLAGLRLQVTNEGARTVRGVVSGWASRYAVKSLDLECDCVWSQPGQVVFEAPPSVEYTLVFLADGQSADFELSLESAMPGAAPAAYRQTFVPEELGVARRFELRADGWQEERSGSTPGGGATVTLSWVGERLEEAQAGEISEELRRRLEALGYTDAN